jgi:hypothetical protein
MAVGSAGELEPVKLHEDLAVGAGAEIVPGDVPGGPSTSQTIMVSSLARLLALLPADAPIDAYRAAIRDENVLGKQTAGAAEVFRREGLSLVLESTHHRPDAQEVALRRVLRLGVDGALPLLPRKDCADGAADPARRLAQQEEAGRR